jgi:hypothetical protein
MEGKDPFPCSQEPMPLVRILSQINPVYVLPPYFFNISFNHSTIKPTNALYFLSMSNNPTYVSAAIEPSSGVQGHVHFNIH